MLQKVLIHGVSTRGNIIHALGAKGSCRTNSAGVFLEEGLLGSDTPKSDQVRIPHPSGRMVSPDLYPELTR